MTEQDRRHAIAASLMWISGAAYCAIVAGAEMPFKQPITTIRRSTPDEIRI